ncbi:Adenylate cyclase 1 [Symbiodinium microadriaticum]|uniref:Adenylate cyclase 1 n=1 Tax=Symbiodinium microadriaticum TaxID=2951 RepID=A0A1Q9D0A8_SYMMI|nr:Adenylate cyclase 1 [Symbiodinium microadriaticum]
MATANHPRSPEEASQEVTIMFSDIRDFTTLSESMAPFIAEQIDLIFLLTRSLAVSGYHWDWWFALVAISVKNECIIIIIILIIIIIIIILIIITILIIIIIIIILIIITIIIIIIIMVILLLIIIIIILLVVTVIIIIIIISISISIIIIIIIVIIIIIIIIAKLCDRDGEASRFWYFHLRDLRLVRIGVNTGHVLSGTFGSDKKMKFGCMGDPVNLASRLEGLCKAYGAGVVCSGATYAYLRRSIPRSHEAADPARGLHDASRGPCRIKWRTSDWFLVGNGGMGFWDFLAESGGFICRKLDLVQVKGRKEAVLVYEVMGCDDDEADEGMSCWVYSSVLNQIS